MAFFSDTPSAADRPAFFASFSTSVRAFFARLSDAQNRTATVRALQQRSDRELADIGIARDNIVRHVYRDIYYL
ncbi:MAG: DUF1127 domain-containing protein [Pseudomonadota bacterium]